MNVEQTFQLIDSLLPYEICSYHQILPLAVQGESLILGMVNPDNVSVLDYVRPILKPKNYFIKRCTLDNQLYQDVLAKYRTYQKRQKLQNESKDDSIPTLISGQSPSSKNESILKNKEAKDLLPTSPSLSDEMASQFPLLEVQSRYAKAPVALLAQLPPHELIPELFGRSLLQNITQISFERQNNHGRIIWSRQNQSKVLLDKLPVPLFQGLLHEMKRLTDFPVKPVAKPQKVEMLRIYENQPILLRLRFKLNQFGEEVAIQIFRGELLQKYQKSQMDQLSQEIIQIANLLDQKLNYIAARTQINPEKVAALPILQKSLVKMHKGITQIQQTQIQS